MFDADVALDKAVEVFWEQGYEAADTGTLAARMGMTKPSVYNAFGAKEELFLKAVDRYGMTFAAAPAAAMTGRKNPRQAVRDFFTTIARNVSGDSHPSGCLYACVAMPLAGRMPKVAEILSERAERSDAEIRAFFDAAADGSALPRDFDGAAAAALMRDLMFSMGLRGRMGATRAELEALAERNADLVLHEGRRGRAPEPEALGP